MEQRITKAQLLETDYFVDNEWLDKYIDLINEHISDEKIVKKTQSHHILPVSYFKHRSLDVDNTDSNRVNLRYRDHMLAHLYLSGCTVGRERYQNLYSVFQLSHFDKEGYLDIQNYDRYEQLYEDAIAAAPNHRKGTRCSEETRAKMRKAARQKMIDNGGAYNKGTIWMNNGEVEMMIGENDLEFYSQIGFKKGRIYRHNEATLAKLSEIGRHRVITDEFREKMRIIGKLSNENRDPESYRKMAQTKREYFKIHPGTFLGKHHTAEANQKNREAHLGRKRIQKDGKIKTILPKDLEKMQKEGWILVPNKEYQRVTDMIFVTDGICNKKIHEIDLPDWEAKGFKRGCIQHHRKEN